MSIHKYYRVPCCCCCTNLLKCSTIKYEEYVVGKIGYWFELGNIYREIWNSEWGEWVKESRWREGFGVQ